MPILHPEKYDNVQHLIDETTEGLQRALSDHIFRPVSECTMELLRQNIADCFERVSNSMGYEIKTSADPTDPNKIIVDVLLDVDDIYHSTHRIT